MSDTIRSPLFPLRSLFAPDYVRIIRAVIAEENATGTSLDLG